LQFVSTFYQYRVLCHGTHTEGLGYARRHLPAMVSTHVILHRCRSCHEWKRLSTLSCMSFESSDTNLYRGRSIQLHGSFCRSIPRKRECFQYAPRQRRPTPGSVGCTIGALSPYLGTRWVVLAFPLYSFTSYCDSKAAIADTGVLVRGSRVLYESEAIFSTSTCECAAKAALADTVEQPAHTSGDNSKSGISGYKWECTDAPLYSSANQDTL
jgi:hypothetical protein